MKKNNLKGRTSYSKNILPSIVQLAADEVEGVAHSVDNVEDNGDTPKKTHNLNAPKKTEVRIDYSDNGVYVEVFISVLSNCRVQDVAFNIQENVKRSVETMTEYKVKAVNVTVVDVQFATE